MKKNEYVSEITNNTIGFKHSNLLLDIYDDIAHWEKQRHKSKFMCFHEKQFSIRLRSCLYCVIMTFAPCFGSVLKIQL